LNGALLRNSSTFYPCARFGLWATFLWIQATRSRLILFAAFQDYFCSHHRTEVPTP
jgi:hypothetical protein